MYVHDRRTDQPISYPRNGSASAATCGSSSTSPRTISTDGRYVAFVSTPRICSEILVSRFTSTIHRRAWRSPMGKPPWCPRMVQEVPQPLALRIHRLRLARTAGLLRSCPTPRILSEILVSRFTSTIHRRAWRSPMGKPRWCPRMVQEVPQPLALRIHRLRLARTAGLLRSCPTPRILSEILVSRFTSTIHRRAWRSPMGKPRWCRRMVQEVPQPLALRIHRLRLARTAGLLRSCPTPRILSEILVSRFTSTIHRRAWRSPMGKPRWCPRMVQEVPQPLALRIHRLRLARTAGLLRSCPTPRILSEILVSRFTSTIHRRAWRSPMGKPRWCPRMVQEVPQHLGANNLLPVVTTNGAFVAFVSSAPNLVTVPPAAAALDVYVRALP